MPLYEIMCIATLQSTPAQLVNTLQRLAIVVQKGEPISTGPRGMDAMSAACARLSTAAHCRLHDVARSCAFPGKGVFRRVENLGTRPLAYRMKAHMKYNTVGR
jgi:ribosomal protein S6